MTDPRAQERSQLPCPVCGAHQLALDTPPPIDVMGIQPYSDLLGMGDMQAQVPPAIVCLACGATWPDRDSFEQARRSG